MERIMKPLPIVWQRLVREGATCPRCESTQHNVTAALAQLRTALRPLGIEPVLDTQALDDAAFRANPSASNCIWIGGQPMEHWLNARHGSSPCCDVCGDLPCRTMEVDGTTYEAIPAELIVRAGVVAAARMLTLAASDAAAGNAGAPPKVKHSIETNPNGVTIRVEAPPEKQSALLEELAKCAAGTCTCPTPQYDKLQSIHIVPQATGVTVTLQANPGEQVNLVDIEHCLDHTTRQAGL
jgi:hypothetical protein